MHPKITEIIIDKLKVKIYDSRALLGVAAAHDVSEKIKELLSKQDCVNIIFAAAPSQNEFLSSLSQKALDWKRVNAFHMDEYVGLSKHDARGFGNFLEKKIFDKLPFREVHYLDGSTGDPEGECERYTRLLRKYSTDIVCMGIGENSHLAFNDPHVADFNDPLMVKIVLLAETSRQQQVNDNCFSRLEDVPTSAITITIPALLKADAIYCVVPGINKAKAVYRTLKSDVQAGYPSTVLRKHNDTSLYLDINSSSKIEF